MGVCKRGPYAGDVFLPLIILRLSVTLGLLQMIIF